MNKIIDENKVNYIELILNANSLYEYSKTCKDIIQIQLVIKNLQMSNSFNHIINKKAAIDLIDKLNQEYKIISQINKSLNRIVESVSQQQMIQTEDSRIVNQLIRYKYYILIGKAVEEGIMSKIEDAFIVYQNS